MISWSRAPILSVLRILDDRPAGAAGLPVDGERPDKEPPCQHYLHAELHACPTTDLPTLDR